MKKVVIANNPMEPENYELVNDVESVMDLIMERFPDWNCHDRVYLNVPSEATDITPTDMLTLEQFENYEGLYIIIRGVGANVVIMIVVAVVVGVAVALLMPTPAVPTLRNTQSTSPNNELASRTNKPRPNARIPDPFGEVRSTFDLLALPYTLFINHQEVEHSYMGVGRGKYAIDSDEVRDDVTRISQILGSSVEFYAPFTSPNSGDAPQLTIGTPINIEIDTVFKSNSVNGQVARAPNDLHYSGNNNIYFTYPNAVNLDSSDDLTETFQTGDTFKIENANFGSPFNHYSSGIARRGATTDYYIHLYTNAASLVEPYASATNIELINCSITVSGTTYNLNGTYGITSVVYDGSGAQKLIVIQLTNATTVNANWSQLAASTQYNANAPFTSKITSPATFNLNGEYIVATVASNQITLNNPSSVNPKWADITETNKTSAVLSTIGDKWIGPFIVDDPTTTSIHCNFVASNGLYKDNGQNQYSTDVIMEVEITPVDANDNPTGSATTHQITIEGSSVVKSTRAATLLTPLLTPSKYSVRARRVSPTDTAFEGTVVDEVRWRDLYSHSPITMSDFGNITTVQSITFATTGALTLKERKLNGLVTRLVRTVDGNGAITEEINASKSAVDIFLTTLLDPYIGNRPANEIDTQNLYDTKDAIISYFGTPKAEEFCYTFDNDNLSLEETLKTIANAIFCEPYRISNKIRLYFEKLTDDSVLLFNHRNKLIGSETRQTSMGKFNNYDGVEYQWVDPKDDAMVTLYIPADQSATNPKLIESVGVRNNLQAHFQAWRVWNKILHQHVNCEFEATQEGELLIKGNRILNTDLTTIGYQEGYVLKQDVLVLTLSQPVTFEQGVDYVIALQMKDASVEIMPVYPTVNPKQVILDHAPRLPLVLGADKYLQTNYLISEVTNENTQAFLVTSRKSNDNKTTKITAVNYSSMYYQNDTDFINNVVT